MSGVVDNIEDFSEYEQVGTDTGYSIRGPAEILNMQFDESDNFLGDRLLTPGGRLSVLGQGGIGKSFLLLQMACCCITGRKFCGIETHAKGLKWLIFQAENPNQRLQSDLIKFRQWLSDDEWRLVENCLLIHTLEIDEDFFHNLMDPQNSEKIIKKVEKHQPQFVAFDPLKDFTLGDLNSDKDIRCHFQHREEDLSDFGLVIRPSGEFSIISTVFADTCAQLSGLYVFDKIINVENKALDHKQLIKFLNAQPEGEVVRIEVLRDNTPKIISLVVERSKPTFCVLTVKENLSEGVLNQQQGWFYN